MLRAVGGDVVHTIARAVHVAHIIVYILVLPSGLAIWGFGSRGVVAPFGMRRLCCSFGSALRTCTSCPWCPTARLQCIRCRPCRPQRQRSCAKRIRLVWGAVRRPTCVGSSGARSGPLPEVPETNSMCAHLCACACVYMCGVSHPFCAPPHQRAAAKHVGATWLGCVGAIRLGCIFVSRLCDITRRTAHLTTMSTSFLLVVACATCGQERYQCNEAQRCCVCRQFGALLSLSGSVLDAFPLQAADLASNGWSRSPSTRASEKTLLDKLRASIALGLNLLGSSSRASGGSCPSALRSTSNIGTRAWPASEVRSAGRS